MTFNLSSILSESIRSAWKWSCSLGAVTVLWIHTWNGSDRHTSLTQKSRIHLKTTVVQLVMKYLALYRTHKFSIVVTKACQPIPF